MLLANTLPALSPACQLSSKSSLHKYALCLFSAPNVPEGSRNGYIYKRSEQKGTAELKFKKPSAFPQFERTSPKAPRPMTLRDSKSSKPSRVLFSRKNSVSLRACCERRITFCKTQSASHQAESQREIREKAFFCTLLKSAKGRKKQIVPPHLANPPHP